MNDENQIFIFLACMLSGVIAGLFYEADCLFCRAVKRKTARTAADILFFIGFAAVFVLIATAFRLPDYRFYMFIGALLGFALYLESLHRILAFFFGKLYNTFRSVRGKFAKRASKMHERRKV